VTVPPGQTLNVRVDHNTTSQVTTSLANGTAVWIVCQTQGTPVNGMWGWTTLWDRLSIGGYASDGFVNTGTNAQVAPNC
jgi:hypothetical protein